MHLVHSKKVKFCLVLGLLALTACGKNPMGGTIKTLASKVDVSTFSDTYGNWIQADVQLTSREFAVVDFFLDESEPIVWKGIQYGRIQLNSQPAKRDKNRTNGQIIFQFNVSLAAHLTTTEPSVLPNGEPLPLEIFTALPALTPSDVIRFPLTVTALNTVETLHFYFALAQDTRTSTMIGMAVPFNPVSITQSIFDNIGFASFSYPPVTTIAGIFLGTKKAKVSGFGLFIDVSNHAVSP